MPEQTKKEPPQFETGAPSGGLDVWMVRTRQNEILGPYTKKSLIGFIGEGKFGPEDEVCQANNYWIYLDEREEVMKQLGIEIQRTPVLGEDDEVTATETLIQDIARTAASDAAGDALAAGGSGSDIEADGTRKTMRPYRGPRSTIREKSPPFRKVEVPFFIRVIISVMVIVMGVLVAWLIHLLHG